MSRTLAALLLCLTLAACGGTTATAPQATLYVGGRTPMQCAPFARALTGVALRGAAADWWWEAAGRYTRSSIPQVGSILVLARSPRLPYGHVAVVTRVLTRRQIMVTQANWVHDRITKDQPVLDVSPRGDWSLVRVWWPPTGQIGTGAYSALGFIRPDRAAEHDTLVAAIPDAVRIAQESP